MRLKEEASETAQMMANYVNNALKVAGGTLTRNEGGAWQVGGLNNGSQIGTVARAFGNIYAGESNTKMERENRVGYIERIMDSIREAAEGEEDPLKAMFDDWEKNWDAMGESAQKALKEVGITKENLSSLTLGSTEVKDLRKQLSLLRAENMEENGDMLKGTKNAMEDIAEYSKDYQSSLGGIGEELNNVRQMNQDLLTISQEGVDRTSEAYTSAVGRLASSTGYSEETITGDNGIAMVMQAIVDKQAQVDATYSALVDAFAQSGFLDIAKSAESGSLQAKEGAPEEFTRMLTLLNDYFSQSGGKLSRDEETGEWEIAGLSTDALNEWAVALNEVFEETNTTADQTVASIDSVLDAMSSSEKFAAVKASWNTLSKETQEAMKKIGIDKKAFEGLEFGTDQFKKLSREMNKIKYQKLEKMNKVMSGTAEMFEQIAKGETGWRDTANDVVKEASKLSTAWEDYNIVMDKSKIGTDEYDDALKDLASATKLEAESLQTEAGMTQALDIINERAESCRGSIEAMANAMMAASTMTFDSSVVGNGYLALGADALAGQQGVASLINTALELLGASIAFVPDGKGGGNFVVSGITGNKNTPKTQPSGGGGGGGGGGGKNNEDESSRQTRYLNQLSSELDKYVDMLDRLEAYRDRFESEGQLTDVINVLEQEQQVLLEQEETYKAIIAELPAMIEQVRAQFKGMTPGSEEYDKMYKRLNELEEAYAKYDKALIENMNKQLENAKSIRETREAIVQLNAELRNTIQQAIMDSQDRELAALEARINMEDEVLDAIKHRHEVERDEIEETTNLQIESLQKETDALSEALDKRRQMAEDEDKMQELLELQAQYSRIIADPTRAKEAREIQQKIADLQEEMAWDAAEREIEAQQEANENRVEELEDYQEYINRYYDDLLENPRNFIDEYNRILSGSDAEIVDWLTRNSENYLNATDAARQDLLNGWKETLDELRMYTRTVWDQVEAIINSGDEGIMQFLINNSQEFREANAYDQQDMIYQWREQLDLWHRAYLDTFDPLDYNEFTNTAYSWIMEESNNQRNAAADGGKRNNLI